MRLHLLSTASRVPVEFAFLPGAANDVRGLGTRALNLPLSSKVYSDNAYPDKVIRKSNSQRQDPPWTQYYKQRTRHQIETVFS